MKDLDLNDGLQKKDHPQDSTPRTNKKQKEKDLKILSEDDLETFKVLKNEIETAEDSSREERYQELFASLSEDNSNLAKELKEWYHSKYQEQEEVQEDKSHDELLNEAYFALEEAKRSFSQITFTDFMKITQLQCSFDEYGKHIDRTVLNDDGTEAEFYKNQQGERKTDSFFNTIKEQVFRILKYLGDFNDLVKSQYFISNTAKNQFFKMASAKVPFYFIFYACEKIQNQLMARYQEDPFKPISFVTYKQWDKDKQTVIKNVVDGGMRTINLSQLYQKMKTIQPTLICVGQRLINKSTLLNSLFNVNFETLAKEAPGIFHDSVDIIFASREFPTGFNVIDFNGQANEDYQMIQILLTIMPKTVLLVQSESDNYIKNVLWKIDENVRKKYANQIVYIDKSVKQEGHAFSHLQMKRCFEGFQNDKKIQDAPLVKSQVFIMGQETQGNLFKSKVNSLREKLAKFFRILEDPHNQIENDRMGPLANINYQGVWGRYWLLEDSFREMNPYKNNFNQLEVIYKDQNFRDYHVELKQYLTDIKIQGIQLSRKLVFPLYNKELEKRKLKFQLEDQDANISEEKKRKIEQELQNLEAHVVEEHFLFKLFKKYYLTKRHDLVNDLLQVVESDYLPRIQGKKKELKIDTDEASKIRDDLQSFYQEQDKSKKKNLNEREEQKFQALLGQKIMLDGKIKQLLDEIEDKVLDSDLFLREAKQFYLQISGPRVDQKSVKEKKEFLQILMNEFQDGKPLEIIDGDMDKCEKHSLQQIMEWLAALKQSSDKPIFVVTVLGPQSSGKSTFLNYLFGAKFAVSAGRCTKGLNAMLLTTDYPEVPDIIILDSEGIFSIERDDPKYDRRLAIFCMSISNLLLINIKGEVNNSVAKVLQIAVYAIKKITECQQASTVPDIKFILRDQVDSNSEFIENTYKQLKAKFTEAAQAANCTLESIINVDKDFSRMVCLFSSAFSQIPYAEKEIMTLSAEVFRKTCSEFRYALIKQQGTRVQHQRSQIVSFGRWANSVDQVWTAVIQNENLMILSDLKSLIDYKFMVSIMEEYRVIMSKPCLKDENGLLVPSYKNPLYVQDQEITDHNEYSIPPEETFYAKCCKIIEEGIQNCNKSGTGAKLDAIIAQVNSDLRLLKQEETQVGEQRVKNATYRMDAAIVSHALRYLHNSIDSIYKKAEAGWASLQASTSIEYSIKATENYLKKWLLLEIKASKNTSEDDFKVQIDQQTEKMRKNVKDKFVNTNPNHFIDQARRQHQMLCSQQLDDAKMQEESKEGHKNQIHQILRHIHYYRKNQIFLKTEPETVQGEVDENLIEKNYAIIDQNQLNSSAEIQTRRQIQEEEDRRIQGSSFVSYVNQGYQYVKGIFTQSDNKALSQYDNQTDSIGKNKKKNKNKQEFANQNSYSYSYDYNQRTNYEYDYKPNYDYEKREKKLKENKILIQTQFKQQIKRDCVNLLRKLGAVRKNVENENDKILEPRPYPQAALQKLIGIFQDELRSQVLAKKENSNYKKYAMYNTNELIIDFNYLIFEEFAKQAEQTERCNEKKIDKRIDKIKENLKKFYQNQTKVLVDTLQVAEEFVQKVDDFVIKLLNSHYADTFNSFFSEVDSKITKNDLKNLTQECFASANYDRKQDIIDFMRNPTELEERVFKERYNMFAREKQQNLEGNYLTEVVNIQEQILKFYTLIDWKMENWIESDEQNENFQLCKYIVEAILSKLIEFPDSIKTGWVSSQQFITGTLGEMGEIPECEEMVNQKLQSKFLSEDEYTILMGEIEALVEKFPTEELRSFIQLLPQSQNKLLGSQKNEVLLSELSTALTSVLDQEPNFDYCLKQALGCPAQCDFCGARCQEQFECKDQTKHKSDCHRPMAFKGTHEEKDGKKVLLRDFCVSQNNFKSRWPKYQQNLQGVQLLHKRLGQEGLKVDTLNVYLCWTSGSDLDINVRCGCGVWHGFGTNDTSCVCNTCNMYRDRDIRTGEDGRTEESTIEHVYFRDERKMVGKVIGMRVFNYTQRSNYSRNDFKMCIFNKYGRQLFPIPGGAQVTHDSSWMYCSSTTDTFSSERNYCLQERDIEDGKNGLTQSFLEYATQSSPLWQYSEADMTMKASDLEFKKFIGVCGEKWQLVREEMCEGFEMLETCAPHLD